MFTASRFIEDCRRALREPEPIARVRALLATAIADPAALDAALGPVAPGEDDCAQYLFLHRSAELTVMRVIMPPHLESPPHDHLVWAAIGLYRGREHNVLYRQRSGHLLEVGVRHLEAPEVMVLSPDIIHGISNPLGERSYALHVYGGALANPARSLWNPFTLDAEKFRLPALQHYERELTHEVERNAT